MGSLYRPKYPPSGMKYAEAKATGQLRESDVWWLKYRDANGIIRRESSGTSKYDDAKRLLKKREGAAAEGRTLLPKADKITFAELVDDLRNDYRVNGRRSTKRLETSLTHLLPYFGHRKAVQLTSAEIRAYVAHRLEEGAANATINRELAALKRTFSLAIRAEKVYRAPHIPMLKANNDERPALVVLRCARLKPHSPSVEIDLAPLRASTVGTPSWMRGCCARQRRS